MLYSIQVCKKTTCYYDDLLDTGINQKLQNFTAIPTFLEYNAK